VKAALVAALVKAGIAFMRLMAKLPLPVVRALGAALGLLLYVVAVRRRRVVNTNLALCFSELSAQERRRLAAQVFVYFAQAWLDRGWLWHAPRARVQQRLKLSGAIEQLERDERSVLFAPHFHGLDAGGTALALHLQRTIASIYSTQSNRGIDAWALRGRRRFGHTHLISRTESVKRIVAELKSGAALYLLPDLDFGPEASVFVPFFGTPAATVPSLSRFAKLGRANVFSVFTRMTREGYEVHISPPWQNFPTDDALADTERMNRELQTQIRTLPAQYHWMHKRFKTRPAGDAGFY
jgi:Kdo2-lipid IVA lauroyltransferase/acyltransferase